MILPAGSPVELHRAYRPDIDGLRALAILSVLGFHAVPEVVGGGFVGVDVFFVISGYLISRIIVLGLRADRFSLRHFYARRIRRIFPALIVVLGACLTAGWLLLLANEYTELGRHVAAASGFIVNLVLWQESGYFDTSAALKPLLHLWSLGVEEQFYIVWPLMLWLAWKRHIHFLALTLVIIAVSYWLCIRATSDDATMAFYSPLTRFWELGLGCSLAFRRTTQAPAVNERRAVLMANLMASAGLLLIAVAVLGLNATVAFPGWRAILPTMGTFLLIAAGPRAWINRWLLSHPVLVWIGLISYPLYLWHWPLLSFAHIQASTPIPRTTRLALVALSVVLAWLTFVCIERPARRGRGRTVAALIALMAAMGSVGVYTVTRNGFDNRFPAAIRAYASFSYPPLAGTRPGCWLNYTQSFTEYPESCIDGGAMHAARPLIFVWGDSHAARLFAGVSQVHGEQYRLAQFARDFCPPVLGIGYQHCRDGNVFVLRKIAETGPAVVVLFAFWESLDIQWQPNSPAQRQLLATIAELIRIGVPRVIVVGPSPKWTRDLPRLVLEVAVRDAPSYRVPRKLRLGLDPSYPAFESSFRQSLIGQPVEYFSIHDAMCDDAGCLTSVADGAAGLVSFDYGHLTTTGASYIAERLMP